MDEPILLVHPDDANLADIKAVAALHGASVQGSSTVPRGKGLLVDGAKTKFGRPS
jgi:hypothetical protein